MSELEHLETFLQNKSKNTVVNYRRQYKKLRDLLDKDISTTGEKIVLLAVKTIDNANSKQALLNIGIVVKKLYDKPHSVLVNERDKNKLLVDMQTKETNVELQTKLPPFKKILEYTDKLYDDNKFIEYIINYLLTNYFVRNKDLLFEIVERKKDMTDPNKNYMWKPKNNKRINFVRQDYKTVNIYGKKSIDITEPKFILAIKRVFNCQKYSLPCGDIIPTESQVGYYVKQMTMNELGENNYYKAAIEYYRDDLQKLKQMTMYRGSSLDVMSRSYDIKNV
tara:strand:+ start:29 stop:865 length:837 start_codon:yes stop_codon:yes gene_type:complete